VGVLLVGRALFSVPDQEGSSPFLFQIPPQEVLYGDQQVVNLPSGDVAEVFVHGLRPAADDIPYSQIYLRLNGAAAARIAEFRPSEKGKLVRLNLRARPGFDLLPGSNILEIEVLDSGGKRLRASLMLHTPKGLCSGSGQARVLSIGKLTGALRSGVTSERLVQYVLDCGVDIAMSPETEKQLRDTGANDRLLLAIRNPIAPEFAEYQAQGIRTQDLLDMLRAGVPQERIVQQVEDRGVNFTFNAEVDQKLRSAGGGDRLLEAVRYMSGAESPGVSSKGLRADEVVRLLENGVDKNRVFDLVRARGVAFRLDPPVESRLRVAGANEKLIKAIRVASEKFDTSH